MTLSRRKTLALLGGGCIVAAGAGVGGFVATRRPDIALQPWDQAGGYDDVRMYALSYAILAPNPHNRQPWLVELVGKEQVILHRDKSREIPDTDPFQRQLVIGLGCFLELMVIAAAERGYGVNLDIYPDGDDGPVAIARFEQGAKTDPLFQQIMHRRTNRTGFELREIPKDAVTTLSDYATVLTDTKVVAQLQQLSMAATSTEMHTPAANRESVELTRFGKAEINANPDGISLGGAFLEALNKTGLLTRSGMLDTESSGFVQAEKFMDDMLSATPAYTVITSLGNERRDQIEAGRRYVRLNLAATGVGLSMHPVSQALQEFSEMAEHYAEAHRLLAKPGETVQMLGRLGFAKAPQESPRWPLKTRILNG